MTRAFDGCVQTLSGRAFPLLAPVPSDFDIREIAHALSMQCRFNGHVRHFYSVAQHSVNVSHVLELWGEPPIVVRGGLLHDAAEAYVGDVVSPLKRLLPAFQGIEDRISKSLLGRYEVPYPLPDIVRRADLAMLHIEARSLLAAPVVPWSAPITPTVDIEIVELSPQEARDIFVDRFLELERRYSE